METLIIILVYLALTALVTISSITNNGKHVINVFLALVLIVLMAYVHGAEGGGCVFLTMLFFIPCVCGAVEGCDDSICIFGSRSKKTREEEN